MNIHTIFPTVITFSELSREFTSREIKCFAKLESEPKNENIGNTRSTNGYVLNELELSDIRDFCSEAVVEYAAEVLKIPEPQQLKITQSWLNYTEKNQFHHRHRHANSLISGVFYLNADANVDKIHFFKEQYDLIRPEVTEWTLLNAERWFFNVSSMQLVLFPSRLEHMVERVEHEATRVSLSFNTFIDGVIGSARESTELKLQLP
jgi:uncharacterized protein (TIGR02466 family)